MKYIEELSFGDIFEFNEDLFVLTKDFDYKNNALCISLKNGQSRWLPNTTIVKLKQLYILDDENNFADIKPKNKQNNQKTDYI